MRRTESQDNNVRSTVGDNEIVRIQAVVGAGAQRTDKATGWSPQRVLKC